MQRSPLISVVVPCYKQADYLPEAVRSLTLQTVDDWECIIVNDGSPDNTRDVAISLAFQDRRVRYIERSNGGPSAARNSGIEYAHGRYIQFLDADDVIVPDKFALQLEQLASAPGPALAFSDYYYSRMDGTPWYDHPCYYPPNLNLDYPMHDMALRWEADLCIPIHCFLFNTRLFTDYGVKFDERLPNHEDWDCWMSLLRLEPQIFYTKEKLAIYRVHECTTTTNHARMRRGFLRAIAKQKRLAHGNMKICRILSQKQKITKEAYRDYSPFSRIQRGITLPLKLALRTALPDRQLAVLRSLIR